MGRAVLDSCSTHSEEEGIRRDKGLYRRTASTQRPVYLDIFVVPNELSNTLVRTSREALTEREAGSNLKGQRKPHQLFGNWSLMA